MTTIGKGSRRLCVSLFAGMALMGLVAHGVDVTDFSEDEGEWVKISSAIDNAGKFADGLLKGLSLIELKEGYVSPIGQKERENIIKSVTARHGYIWVPRKLSTAIGSLEHVLKITKSVGDAVSSATKIGQIIGIAAGAESFDDAVDLYVENGIYQDSVYGEASYWLATISTGMMNGRSLTEAIADGYDEKYVGPVSKLGYSWTERITSDILYTTVHEETQGERDKRRAYESAGTLPTPKVGLITDIDPFVDTRRMLGFDNDDGPYLILTEDYVFKDYNGIEYTIPKGFIFDGMSIPTSGMTGFLSAVFMTGENRLSNLAAGLIHDYQYRNPTMFSKEAADRMFRSNLIRLNDAHADALYDGVRYFGAEAYRGHLENVRNGIYQFNPGYYARNIEIWEALNAALHVPQVIGLVIDRSGSMSSADMQNVKARAKELIAVAQLGAAVSVMSFSTGTTMHLAMTEITAENRVRLMSAVDGIVSKGSGDTALWDSAMLMLNTIANFGSSVAASRSLILLTDGGDNRSSAGPADVIAACRLMGVKLNSIAYGDNVDTTLLEEVSGETGGVSTMASQDDFSLRSAFSRTASGAASRVTIADQTFLSSMTSAHEFVVDSTVGNAQAVVTMPAYAEGDRVSMVSPNGTDVVGARYDVNGTTTFVFPLQGSAPGKWTVNVATSAEKNVSLYADAEPMGVTVKMKGEILPDGGTLAVDVAATSPVEGASVVAKVPCGRSVREVPLTEVGGGTYVLDLLQCGPEAAQNGLTVCCSLAAGTAYLMDAGVRSESIDEDMTRTLHFSAGELKRTIAASGCVVRFLADDGTEMLDSIVVCRGGLMGDGQRFPVNVPSRGDGHVFKGWITDRDKNSVEAMGIAYYEDNPEYFDGTGSSAALWVTAETAVPNKDQLNLWPVWSRQTVPFVPGVAEGLGSAAVLDAIAAVGYVLYRAADAVDVYDGYLHDASGRVAGKIKVSVVKDLLAKKGENRPASVWVTIQLADGSKKIRFMGGTVDGLKLGKVTGLASGGHALSVDLDTYGLSGTFRRAGSNVSYQIDGAKNVFFERDAGSRSIVKTIAKKWLGKINASGNGFALTVSIAKNGSARISGTANGRKVHARSRLLINGDVGCVPVMITKKANLSFNLCLAADGSVSVSGVKDVVANWAGALNSGAKFWIKENDANKGQMVQGLYDEYLPNGVSVSLKNKKWVVAGGAKKGKVVLKRKTSEIDQKKSKFTENMSGLKLTYKAKNASFKGSFKAYVLENGKIKSYKIKVNGVMVGDRGYGTATSKKLSVSWPIVIE